MDSGIVEGSARGTREVGRRLREPQRGHRVARLARWWWLFAAAAALSACIKMPTRVPDSERCRMGAPGACTPDVCAAYDAGELPAGCLPDADGDSNGVDIADEGAGNGLDVSNVDMGPVDGGLVPGPDAAVECLLDADCTTAALCKVARCQDGSCVEVNAAENLSCDDGDPCTEGDHCVAGSCVATPKSCDDGVACTDDTCDPTTGQCSHDTAACPCSPATAAADCDDGNPCTEDSCVDGTCTSAPTAEGQSCDDGSACTQGDECQNGLCLGTPTDCSDDLACSVDACDPASGQCLHDTAGCGCVQDSDCDDGDPCTLRTCSADGACQTQNAPSATTCDDGDPCTEGDHCQDGGCEGTTRDCSDGLTCSVDGCDASSGQCLHDTSPCGCTQDADCDDGNPCTTESCLPSGTCQVDDGPNGTACDDGDACTVDDHCEAGVCSHTPKDCDDGVACTTDACAPTSGSCSHDPTACACAAGSAAVDCDDGNPCTSDACTPSLECAHQPLTGGGVTCSDGDPCTVNDACQAGTCVGVAKTCDDGVACTADSCDTATGQCAVDDSACECLTASDCDDQEPCTTDVCQPDRTCAHTPLPNDMACQGNGPGAVSGACYQGACRGVLDVAVGWRHACAILETGDVRCWSGPDDGSVSGQVGAGDTSVHTVGVPVYLGSGQDGKAVAVDVSGFHSCVATASGKVRCWGNNDRGQLGAGNTTTRLGGTADPPSTVTFGSHGLATSVTLGRERTCALLDTGAVACWGDGGYGALGSLGTFNLMDQALELPAYQSLQAVALTQADNKLSLVYGSASPGHACALIAGGDVRCWGQAASGALGTFNGTEDLMDEPGEVPSLLTLGAVQISARNGSTCVVTESGAVRCWGVGARGKLGSGGTENLMDEPGEGPSTVPLPGPAVAVTVGEEHACAIVEGGDVYCWGRVDWLGQGWLWPGPGGDTEDALDESGEAPPLVDLGEGELAVRIDAGYDTTCAVLASRQVKCWGSNYGPRAQSSLIGFGTPGSLYANVMGAPGSACSMDAECLSGACQDSRCD